MRIGLFLPCYVDQLYPQVGVASLELLEKAGCEVIFLNELVCCGQPMDNSGFEHLTARHHYKEAFEKVLREVDYLVSPSGSCTYHLLHHVLDQDQDRKKIWEITAFFCDVLPVEFSAFFPYRVALHQSCHGLRGLKLGNPSELPGPSYSKMEQLLKQVNGLELVPAHKADECCGFGGSFALTEAAVSVRMGEDKVRNLEQNDPQYIAATDMSCLMHLEGIIRNKGTEMRIIHPVEILNSQK